MHTVFADTPADAYIKSLQHALAWGLKQKSRVGDMLELLDLNISIDRPGNVIDMYTSSCPDRKLNPAIGAMEALQLIGQVSLPEVHTDRIKVFKSWLDDGIFHGAYGQRVHGHLSRLIAELTENPDSRRAVITIYDADKDLHIESKDIPCTLTLQFFIRNGALNLRASMRSNDLWRGLPYDLTQFIALQGAVAAALNTSVGRYTHTVGSAHLYMSDRSDAVALAESDFTLTERSTPLDMFPPYQGISEISTWARVALIRPSAADPHETPFQTWLRESTIKKETTRG